MAVTMEQIRRLTITANTQGLAAAEAELRKMQGAYDGVSASAANSARVTDETAKSVERAGATFDRAVRQADALAKAQHTLATAQRAAMLAINSGSRSPEDVARGLVAFQANYDRAAEAAKRFGAAQSGVNTLNSTQRSMLSSGAFNAIGSLGSGAPVTQVMLQQGADLAQAFSMGPNGVGGTFAALRGIFVSWLPTIVGVTAALGPLIAVGYGFFRFRSEVESLGHSLDGLGRRSGETMSSLSALAARGATAGGLSISEGRAAAAAYAGAGIGGGINEGLIAQTKAFARVTGTDLDTASKTLATAFADPTKGAQQLGDMLGFVDQKTKESITSFQRQGDIISARRMLFDAMSRDLAAAADRTTHVAKGWTAIGNAISDATGRLGEWTARQAGLSGASPEDAGLQEIRGMIAKYGNPYSGWAFSRKDRLDELRQQEREITRGQGYRSFSTADKAADMAANQQGQVVAGYISSVLPEMDKRRTLADQIAAIEKAMNDPSMLARMGDAAGRVGEALGLMRDQLNGSLSAMEKIRLESDLAMQGVKARSDFERASLAASKSLGGIDPFSASPEARAKASSDYALVMAQAQREAQDRLRSANDNLGLVGILPYQRQIAEIENRTRRQNEMNAGNKDALASNSAARAAELSAAAQAAISVPLANANRELEAQNRLLVVNAATFGMTTDRVVAASTAQEMFNKYLLAGVPITAELSAGVLRYAESMGIAAKAAEDLKDRQQKALSAMDDLRSETKGLISDLAKGKKPQDIVRGIGERMIDRGAGNLTEMLLGPQGKMGGGLFGGFFGGVAKDVFGVNAAARNLAVATQNVQAGVVNIGGAGIGSLGLNGGALGAGGNGNVLDFVGGQGGASRGVSTGPADYLGRMFKIESGGDPSNKTGSNYGIAQFGYADMRRFGLADPFDVKQATTASLMEARQNAEALRPVLGRDATGADLYLAHQQGLAGSKALFQNPDMPAWQAVRPFYGSDEIAKKAISGNAGSVDMTSRQFTDMWANRYNATKPMDLAQVSGANEALSRFQETTNGATGNLGSFGDGLGKMGSTLLNGLSGQGGGGGLFGLLAGFFGMKFAAGGAFMGGNIIPFADGGVVSGATRFGMSGGRHGVMGEAGPEAIMPLSRAADGKLGVKALVGPMPGVRQTVNTSVVSVTIGGHTIHVQGDATAETREYFAAEMDRRDKKTRKHIEDQVLAMSRKQAGFRG